MKHRPLHTAALLLAAFAVLGSQPALFAQSTFASISGAVRDNSAAIVQGAEVTLTEVQTNLVQRTMSSENGDYRLLNLPAGRYVVQVVKSGFDKFQTQEFELVADALVACAGLHADRVAHTFGVEPSARIVPFRGEYFELTPRASALVNGLIYPVPDPRFPFLGVHLTASLHGGVHAGPNAVFRQR